MPPKSKAPAARKDRVRKPVEDPRRAGTSTASRGSVSLLIDGVKAGDKSAAGRLYERYLENLVLVARSEVRALPRRYPVIDEEGAVQSALVSFFKGAAAGQFPELKNREQLKRLLAAITVHKILHQVEREETLKRGGGNLLGESALPRVDEDGGAGSLDRLASDEQTPEFIAIAAETLTRMLDGLAQDVEREVLVLRLKDYEREEIAEHLRCSVRTVTRHLDEIRKAWLAQDEELRQVLNLLLAGCPRNEIAEKLGWTQNTVARKIELISKQWLMKPKR
jgi:DNA-directed RNA polymerase specialized sigma24 family protein